MCVLKCNFRVFGKICKSVIFNCCFNCKLPKRPIYTNICKFNLIYKIKVFHLINSILHIKLKYSVLKKKKKEVMHHILLCLVNCSIVLFIYFEIEKRKRKERIEVVTLSRSKLVSILFFMLGCLNLRNNSCG